MPKWMPVAQAHRWVQKNPGFSRGKQGTVDSSPDNSSGAHMIFQAGAPAACGDWHSLNRFARCAA
jgi:hypothetical protein